MRTNWVRIVLIIFSMIGFATSSTAAEKPGNYLALKGGIYSPSATFDLDNVDVETTFDGDTETGFNGEIAFGHYLLPTFVLELGIGYLQGKGTYQTSVTRGQVDFDVIPVVLSAKVLVPVGAVDPYGEVGIGAYFSEFNVDDSLNTFDGTTTFGIHAGAGINVAISPKVFVGAEARYVWAEPSFGGQTIGLNGEDYELNGFELNGFTTTLVLGYRF